MRELRPLEKRPGLWTSRHRRRASMFGVRVIATVESEAKAVVARRNGAAHIILYWETDMPTAVRAPAAGGIDLVFDGVAGDTLPDLLAEFRPQGRIVKHGDSSGPPPVDLLRLPMFALLAPVSISTSITSV
jgi:NADPH2:quinone reductase